jgi:hypothetical protein
VLAFQLPVRPAYARVKIWRRLQSVGAATFKNALYLLPSNDEALEDFEWILREIRELKGEGLILDARAVQGFSNDEIVGLFDAARKEQYAAIAEEIRKFCSRLARKRGQPTPADIGAQHARFQARLAAIEAIDFFQANGREQAHAALRVLEPHMKKSGTERGTPAVATAALSMLKGRVWVTRANVHIDRMASAWLIRRWIDPEATFKFVTQRNYKPSEGEIRFDMYEAEFTHDGDCCTFEVLVKKLGRRDSALGAISEIVHDLDLKDHKYAREEAAGIQQLLSGIVAEHAGDSVRIERAAQLFNDLYRSFSKGALP